jgi:hypothetical protein
MIPLFFRRAEMAGESALSIETLSQFFTALVL